MATNALGYTPEQELLRRQVDHGPQLRGIFISLIPLSTVFMFLRFTARRIARMKVWWDDWLAIVAWVFAVVLNIILILAVDNGGLGKHAEFAGKGPIIYGLKILFTSEIIYQISMTCIKLSILLFYYRLFKMSRYFNNALWVMSTVTLCWYCTSTFVIIFQCKPITFLWNHTIPGGQCVPQERLWIGSSVTSLLTDVAVLCLPLPMIWKLYATRNQKIALSGVFLLGAFVCITSIVRLANIDNLDVMDPSFSYVAPAIWTSVECSVAVISACLPTLKPLFRTLFELTDVLPFDAPRKESDDATTQNSPSLYTPDPQKQWRANANARRICELSEVQTEDEKRFGRNHSRPWMGKSSVETMGIGHKSSYNSIAARDFSTHKPSRDTMRTLGGGQTGLGIEIRNESPHLWGRDDGRGGMRPVRLPGFEFEPARKVGSKSSSKERSGSGTVYGSDDIVSLPSPSLRRVS